MPGRLSHRQDRPSTRMLALRVKAERMRLGLSQTQAAEILGINRASYQNMESVTVLQYGQLVALVRMLGMDPRALAFELFADAPPAAPGVNSPDRTDG